MLCGLLRENCHLELLNAVFTADVDVLMPPLYYACADYPMREILLEEPGLGQKCINTLLVGREAQEGAIVDLITTIPEKVYGESEDSPCMRANDEVCLEEVRFSGLEQFTGTTCLKAIGGSIVARKCITPLCIPCRTKIEELVDNKWQTIWDNIHPILVFLDGTCFAPRWTNSLSFYEW